MEQRHSRHFDAQRAGHSGGVAELGSTLFEGGSGDDGHVGEEQQTVGLAGFEHGHVTDDIALGAQAIGFVEHLAQEVVGVDHPFHEEVDLPVVYQLYGLPDGLSDGGGRPMLDVGRHFGSHPAQSIFVNFAHKDSVDESHLDCFNHSTQGVVVGRMAHGHTGTLRQRLQAVVEGDEGGDGRHSSSVFKDETWGEMSLSSWGNSFEMRWKSRANIRITCEWWRCFLCFS